MRNSDPVPREGSSPRKAIRGSAAARLLTGGSLLLGLAGVVACGHAKQEVATTAELGPGVKETIQGNEVVKAYDLNGDGKPDAFEYYVRGKDDQGHPVDRLDCKEFDLNSDGKIDLWRWYDEKENLVREAMDTDFDGKVDVVTYFVKNQRVKEERDFDDQGKPHTWVYFEKNQLVRKEKDLHGTGKPDYFEYWEGGAIDRIGIESHGLRPGGLLGARCPEGRQLGRKVIGSHPTPLSP